ncbi:MAG TPA: alpha/beta hydrolase [Pilimelia sp.]|nr:alpha/beta hydrolase [Pilimelia sp.]
MKRAILVSEAALPSIEPPPPWPGRAVMLDSSAIFVRETPATAPGAEPALYVHGLGGSAQNWTDLAALLAGRLDGQAIDLPGFGHSDPVRNCSIAAFADRVVRWIEYADRGPVHLFGNSLGGAIAVRAAGCRPDLVRSLTLVSPAMPFLNPRRSLQGRVLPLLAVPRAERIAARLLAQIEPAEMARQVVEACFADPQRIAEQRMAEAIEEIRLRYTVAHYPGVYLRTLRGLVFGFLRAYLPGSNSLWRIARQITAPTLVIGGLSDRLVDVRVAPQVARMIPDSRLLMLHGVGHVAQMEVPHMVARAALGMLDEMAGVAPPRRSPARLVAAPRLLSGPAAEMGVAR